MVHISEQRLNSLLDTLNGKTIAVIGDLMLDSYIWGKVNRISPEAPVPVVDVETEQVRLGGAANVAHNIKSLGGKPLLVGVLGDDSSGKKLLNIIRENAFPVDGIVVDHTRPTTVKTRIIAHSQHVVRIDRESREEISYTIQNGILETLLRNSEAIDGIIIEDYNKGVVVKSLIHQIIKWANQHKKPITVDPKYNNFFEFADVTVFKPNRKEVEEVLGLRMNDDHEVITAGKKILERLNSSSVLLTRGEQGMSLFEKDGSVTHVPTKARSVADVSGAGDTVIATLTMALVGGATIREASTLANIAGGIVCGSVGIVPIDKNELRDAVLQDMNHRPRSDSAN